MVSNLPIFLYFFDLGRKSEYHNATIFHDFREYFTWQSSRFRYQIQTFKWSTLLFFFGLGSPYKEAIQTNSWEISCHEFPYTYSDFYANSTYQSDLCFENALHIVILPYITK